MFIWQSCRGWHIVITHDVCAKNLQIFDLLGFHYMNIFYNICNIDDDFLLSLFVFHSYNYKNNLQCLCQLNASSYGHYLHSNSNYNIHMIHLSKLSNDKKDNCNIHLTLYHQEVVKHRLY